MPNARRRRATDDAFRSHLESAISVCAAKVNGYVTAAGRSTSIDGIR
jgi:hypothetical protein